MTAPPTLTLTLTLRYCFGLALMVRWPVGHADPSEGNMTRSVSGWLWGGKTCVRWYWIRVNTPRGTGWHMATLILLSISPSTSLSPSSPTLPRLPLKTHLHESRALNEEWESEDGRMMRGVLGGGSLNMVMADSPSCGASQGLPLPDPHCSQPTET